jgi:thiamine kinase-like enzyme
VSTNGSRLHNPRILELLAAYPPYRITVSMYGATEASYEADLDLLDGDALLHTDFNPLNVLLGLDRVWIVDWAWPTRGAAFIDAACLLIRAMAAGHSAEQAETLACLCPGWRQAPSVAIDIFALASARLYDEIARDDPQPVKQRLAAVASAWAGHRLGAGLLPATPAGAQSSHWVRHLRFAAPARIVLLGGTMRCPG